jgi:iron complex transport system substrate-binding protein
MTLKVVAMDWKVIGAVTGAALIVVVVALLSFTQPPPVGGGEGGTAYPVEVVDDLNRTVVIQKEPERIVALSPSTAEILYYLGVFDRVVGVTDYSDYPPEVSEKERVGGYWEPDVEKIINLTPDLVIGVNTPAQINDVLPMMEEAGIPMVILDPRTIEDIYANILLVGKIVNVTDKAEEVVADMKEKIEGVEKALEGVSDTKVFYIVWNDPLMTAEVIEIAGGINIFNDATTSWPTVDLEEVIVRNPDVIVLSAHCGLTPEDIYTNESWSTINAVKNGSVLVFPDENLLVRPGPRIADGVLEMAKMLHPEAFNTTAKVMELASSTG